MISKVEESCAKHGEQFVDHFGEKGIADRFCAGFNSRQKFMLQFAYNFDLEGTIDIFRFRANLVVEGGEAFAEETWSGFHIAGAEFKVGGPCRRFAFSHSYWTVQKVTVCIFTVQKVTVITHICIFTLLEQNLKLVNRADGDRYCPCLHWHAHNLQHEF